MRKFTTTYYKLSSNGKFPEGNGFRLAFISDLHNMEFGPDNTVLKAVIDEAAPDLVIIGGDQIVAKPGENLDPGLSFAERLAEEYQVIYGCGNHEYRLKLYPEQYSDLYEKLRERLKRQESAIWKMRRRILPSAAVRSGSTAMPWTAPITTAFTADRCRFRN